MWKLLIRNRGFVFSLGALLAIIMFGAVGPMFVRNPLEIHKDSLGRTRQYEPPSLEFILGTDDFGRDVFSQLAYGTRNSLIVGVFAGVLATLIAVLVGSIGAYKGGLIDDLCNGITTIILSFPMLPLLTIIATLFEERSLFFVGLLIAVVSWPWAARAIRAQVLSLKEREFVDLARVSGMRESVIVITEILPNLLAYVLMVFVIITGGAVAMEAGVSMMGAGPSETITLGMMLFWAISNETIRSGFWWEFIPPGFILTAILMVIYVLHSSMDEVFNPRLRKM